MREMRKMRERQMRELCRGLVDAQDAQERQMRERQMRELRRGLVDAQDARRREMRERQVRELRRGLQHEVSRGQMHKTRETRRCA